MSKIFNEKSEKICERIRYIRKINKPKLQLERKYVLNILWWKFINNVLYVCTGSKFLWVRQHMEPLERHILINIWKYWPGSARTIKYEWEQFTFIFKLPVNLINCWIRLTNEICGCLLPAVLQRHFCFFLMHQYNQNQCQMVYSGWFWQ